MYAGEKFVGHAQMAGSIGGEATPKRMPELPAQVDNLERGINFVEESLNELAARIEGVLRPAMPEPAGSAQQIQPAPPSSGYASTIHGQAGRVTRLGDRLQDMLRRLEV